MKKRTGVLIAALTSAALLAPTAAFAYAIHTPRDSVTIDSAKIPLHAGQTEGWAFYCPSSDPYLQAIRADNQWVPDYQNLSDSGVSATNNPDYTDPGTGKLAITFTNWNLFHGENGQVSYVCTTQQP